MPVGHHMSQIDQISTGEAAISSMTAPGHRKGYLQSARGGAVPSNQGSLRQLAAQIYCNMDYSSVYRKSVRRSYDG